MESNVFWLFGSFFASFKLFWSYIVPRKKNIEKMMIIVKLFCLSWAVSSLMSWVNSILTFTLLLFSFPLILLNILANCLSTFCKGVTASWSFVMLKSIYAVSNLFGLARFSYCHHESLSQLFFPYLNSIFALTFCALHNENSGGTAGLCITNLFSNLFFPLVGLHWNWQHRRGNHSLRA